ncbi:MAG: cobalamin B12-binding domain-containing protein [Phycisphaerales bacterium]
MHATASVELVIDSLLPNLLQGDRATVRTQVARALGDGLAAEDFTEQVAWPLHESLHKLHRLDQIERISFNYATRLLRSVVDQVQLGYRRSERNGQRVMLFCGSGENEDLGGQMAADLLEAAGYEVFFAGGGVARDEILEETHRRTPDFLVLFASAAADAPTIRAIIDQVREVGAHPGLQIAVGGGVFNRAAGLAEAIGATRFARTPMELVRALAAPPAAARHAIGEPRRARAVA